MTIARLHRAGVMAVSGLILWCLAWEWFIAPLRPGGSWLMLKVIPLVAVLIVLVRAEARRRYYYQLSTLVIWFYFTEGVVRAWSDLLPLSRLMALGEVALSLLIFAVAAWYARRTATRPSQHH
jgi:uncharacterized membrane protein